MTFRYLVYDIETCTDKALLNKVLYAGEGLSDEEAFLKHLEELSAEDRTFVNPAFHVPISIAAIGLDSDFEILKLGLMGKDSKRPAALVQHFWETYNQNRPVLI